MEDNPTTPQSNEVDDQTPKRSWLFLVGFDIAVIIAAIILLIVLW